MFKELEWKRNNFTMWELQHQWKSKLLSYDSRQLIPHFYLPSPPLLLFLSLHLSLSSLPGFLLCFHQGFLWQLLMNLHDLLFQLHHSLQSQYLSVQLLERLNLVDHWPFNSIGWLTLSQVPMQ